MRLLIILLIFVTTNTLADTVVRFNTGLNADVTIGTVDGVRLSMNVALPNRNNKKLNPGLVFIHGGGLIKGDKNKFNKLIVKMSKRGVVAASVMYRLAPKHRFPSAIEDVKSAVRFLKAHSKALNLDPNRIVVSGISAGGYLATMVGVTGNASGFSHNDIYPSFNSSVRAVISQSGSLADFTRTEYKDFVLVDRFMNLHGDDENQSLAEMSPITYLDKNDPPFFLAHGSEDEIVPVQMTRDFVFELEKIGHNVEYIEVKGGKHNIKSTLPSKSSEVFRASIDFFIKHTLH